MIIFNNFYIGNNNANIHKYVMRDMLNPDKSYRNIIKNWFHIIIFIIEKCYVYQKIIPLNALLCETLLLSPYVLTYSCCRKIEETQHGKVSIAFWNTKTTRVHEDKQYIVIYYYTYFILYSVFWYYNIANALCTK